jgi:hypothetical protein
MLDKAMRKSVESYLEPGEELLNVMIVQGKGQTFALMAGGVAGQAAMGAIKNRRRADGAAEGNGGEDAGGGGVKLASKMGIAITPRRLLIFKAGGAITVKAKELLTDVPISDVDSVEVGKGKASKPVTFTVRGESFQVEAPKISKTDDLVAAFQKAKSGAGASA